MQQFLENPTIGREAKKAFVVNMLSKQKYSDLVVNFFKAMADYGRLNDSLKAIAEFEKNYERIQFRNTSQSHFESGTAFYLHIYKKY